jgi:hypothetical protein
VLGFAASRFLKASSRDRYQTSRPDRYRGYPATSSAYATGGEGVATGAGGLPPMPPVEKPGL